MALGFRLVCILCYCLVGTLINSLLYLNLPNSLILGVGNWIGLLNWSKFDCEFWKISWTLFWNRGTIRNRIRGMANHRGLTFCMMINSINFVFPNFQVTTICYGTDIQSYWFPGNKITWYFFQNHRLIGNLKISQIFINVPRLPTKLLQRIFLSQDRNYSIYITFYAEFDGKC